MLKAITELNTRNKYNSGISGSATPKTKITSATNYETKSKTSRNNRKRKHFIILSKETSSS